ncbi:uncharacterized protein JCM6883_006021 [Sporobolomyces salmoneus]|uniref:uncharacterized protein n=1 Tax=Sporobolomyces salmoneus TaxID=183962 RepID=UPI00317B31B9
MQQPPKSNQIPDLDLLRPRLAQLINSISTLTSHLLHAFHNSPPSSTIPPTLPFPDLLNRYSLLISQFNSLIGLISSQSDLERERDRPQEANVGKRRKEERDVKRDKWAGVSIVPREPVEESKDWIVGLLLRTKQTPEVENRQAQLLDSLPSHFKASLSASDPNEFATLLAAQTRLLNSAYDRVNAAKQFSADGGEEWDWKGRVELEAEDDEDPEDSENSMQVDDPPKIVRAVWSEEDLATYLRTGKKPFP